MDMLSELLERHSLRLEEFSRFASDLGPGSFTGVKVGVTLAKTLAFAVGGKATGASSFDLIDPSRDVVFPSKRGEWFVRRPGQPPIRQPSLPEGPFVGYGEGIAEPLYPHASGFSKLLTELVPLEPERLMPEYLMEPSISVPKQPYR